MYNKSNIKINLSGGVTSPTSLASILHVAQDSGVGSVSFGARQQLLFNCPNKNLIHLGEGLKNIGVEFETETKHFPNILSSYSTAGIFAINTESWLTEGIYLDMLNTFTFKPQLKINICDIGQSHAPFFTGHLNFISSDVPHFWFLFVRYPQSKRVDRLPMLVYSQDVAELSHKIEENILKLTTFPDDFLEKLSHRIEGIIFRAIEHELTIPRFVMPYFEGVNSDKLGKMWLGIYRRDENFDINFLIELCQLCEHTRIGNIGITAWRSLIIKKIEPKNRFLFEKLLSKHGINVRHGHVELNWQTEDNSRKGYNLKRFLVRKFDISDMRTFGLVFAIKTRRKSEVFGSVIIRRHGFFKFGNFDVWGFGGMYDIFYAEDFNPHTRIRRTHRLNVPRWRLPEELFELVGIFFNDLTGEKKDLKMSAISVNRPKTKKIQQPQIYQCSDCLTVYDPIFGEPEVGISAGTTFDDLPESFKCAVCEAEKSTFRSIEKSVLQTYL